MTKICEILSERDGNIVRRIGFTRNGKEYLVYEQEAYLENAMDSKVKWRTPFSHLYQTIEQARAAFIGRTTALAYEEGNIDFPQPILAYRINGGK